MYDISRIEREMAEQFLSPTALAKKAGVPASTVLRIFENKRGNPETIGKLVVALNLDPKDVVLVVAETVAIPEPKTTKAEHELMESARKS